jgi:hypothetical protein
VTCTPLGILHYNYMTVPKLESEREFCQCPDSTRPVFNEKGSGVHRTGPVGCHPVDLFPGRAETAEVAAAVGSGSSPEGAKVDDSLDGCNSPVLSPTDSPRTCEWKLGESTFWRDNPRRTVFDVISILAWLEFFRIVPGPV